MWRYCECLVIVTLMIIVINVTWATSVDVEGDYQMPLDSQDNGNVLGKNEMQTTREIRCYCNQPECVPQGYMCRGISGCFTKLPSHNTSSLSRPEHSVHNGCLVEREQCPPGFLCCEQDLCNHVDSPAVISRLNKTLRIFLVGDQQQVLQPNQDDDYEIHHQRSTIQIIKSAEESFWIKTATISVAICGIFVLLILTFLAIRLLQPAFPMQAMDKRLGSHIITENTPPLLELRKAPFV